MNDFLEKLKLTINRHMLIGPGDGVVVAVSGGPDSMALLHSLVSLREELGIRLQVVHVNHCLRGEEADQEAAFVQEIAASWDVPVKVYRVEVARLAQRWRCSLQEAGRRVRYQALEETAQALSCQRIAVAHHAQDQAETILENILRGSGLTGLGGMRYQRGPVVRPLLDLTREEIELYLKENQVPYCLDPSNQKLVYLRNRIRLELIPYLQEKYNPNIVTGLNRMAEIIRDDNDLLEELAAESAQRCLLESESALPTGSAALSISQLLTEPVALRRRVLRRILGKLSGDLRQFSYDHIERLLELAVNPVGGRRIYLPGNLQGRREYNRLIIETRMVRRKKER